MKASLFLLAHGRSGDKGDAVNIGIIARRRDWYPFLVETLTADRVRAHMTPLVPGPVLRYELPNLSALNFILPHALHGGGTANMQLDAQGKTYAQALLRMIMDIPHPLAAQVRAVWADRMPDDCLLEG